MHCDQICELLPAYVDGELDPSGVAQLLTHLDDCPACSTELREIRAVSGMLAMQATRYQAPAALRASVQAAIAQEAGAARARASAAAQPRAHAQAGEGAQPQQPQSRDDKRADLRSDRLASTPARSAPRPPRRWSWNMEWLRLGGVSLASAACAAVLAVHLTAPADAARDSDEVIASHFRSLQVDHLTDVTSTDQHTVKPWFAGKLDFSPPVYDFAAQGFPLIGGRLDYLHQRNVAVMAYRHRQHMINLFVWPDARADSAPHDDARQGIHVRQWHSGGMQFWLVSDMGAQELDQFGRLLQTRVASHEQ